MDMKALVDARLTLVYQNVCDGLQIVSLPVMLAPVCPSCFKFCDQEPCVICGAALCSTCARECPCALFPLQGGGRPAHALVIPVIADDARAGEELYRCAHVAER